MYGSFPGGDFLDLNSINERDSSNDLGDQLGAIEQPTFWEADRISLQTIVRQAVLEPLPRVRLLRSLTVAKVDSIGLVVRKWPQ